MTPQAFVEWGRRIADDYAQSASRKNPLQLAHEYDSDTMAAEEFLNKSNEVGRAFTIPDGLEKLALTPALHDLQGPTSSPDRDATFNRIFAALQPVLTEILEGMWLGEWDFNDSGLFGTLKIQRESASDNGPFRVVYVDSQSDEHETVVATTDEEYCMSYESLHVEVKYGSTLPWKIHAFIFRWDRQKMAGIVDHGETEGRHSFYAVKKGTGAQPPPLPPSFSGR